MGKGTELGMSVLSIANKDFSCRYTWMTSKWPEREAKYGSHVEEIDEKC